MLVQPGWQAVIPCSTNAAQIHWALHFGSFDLPVGLQDLGYGELRSLRDVAAIPREYHE